MRHDIDFTCDSHIGVITLNRTAALNALTYPMIKALQEQLQIWKYAPDVHAVVVCSSDSRAFCAGGDVRSIYNLGINNYEKSMDFFKREYDLNRFIYEFGKPYIALMDGITMGGGVGISLHGSHPVASSKFIFAMPETGIGFFPDIGASFLLARIPNFWGVYLGLTGARIGAIDAAALGLVKYIISAAHFPNILTMLHDTDLSVEAHARVDAILQPFATPLKTESRPLGSEIPLAISGETMTKAINSAFQYADINAILRALSGVDDEWHRDTYNLLMHKSPLSLKVTLMQLQKAKFMTLEMCLQMDLCLTRHFMQHNDFYEGVRALLIDKDHAPRWQPATIDDVSAAQVDDYFNEVY